MYDYPSAPPSASSLPPSPHKHHYHGHHTQHHVPHHGNHRSHSPIPHIATLLPHSHNNSQYSPATHAADISRLLDPAYASASSSSGSSTCPSPTHHARGQTRAYVDRNGNLHDPDYRDFPVLPLTSLSSSATRRRRTSDAPMRSRSTSRATDSRCSNYTMRRPGWERDWSTEVEDEDEGEVGDDDTESQSHYSPFASHASMSMRRSASLNTARAFQPYPAYSQFVGESQPISSSPAGSFEEEHQGTLLHNSRMPEQPFLSQDQEMYPQEAPARSSGRSSILRKGSRKGEAKANVDPLYGDSEKGVRMPQQQLCMDSDQLDDVPTCAASLCQQWQAAILRLRFGIFHAKRRLSMRRRRRSSAPS